MQLLSPGVLADACGLSVPLTLTFLAAGAALWLFGWRSHRFWAVLAITVLAGVYGLYEARSFGSQPLVTALLMALAAGVLALALVRLLAFLAGGVFGVLLVQGLAPNWDQPLLCFLVCGLLGLVLFRLWMMALTSVGGATVVGYSVLCLLNQTGSVNPISFTENQYTLLNGLCGFWALLGFGFQFWYDQRRRTKDKEGGPAKDEEAFSFSVLPLLPFLRKPAKKAG